MCIDLAADGIIILMVESEFALVKSQNMIRDIFGENTEKFDVIEHKKVTMSCPDEMYDALALLLSLIHIY